MISYRFLKSHSQALNPPDIRTFKDFVAFYVCNTEGRIEEKPTVNTVNGFRRDFEAAILLKQEYRFPPEVSTTIREVYISHSFLDINLNGI